MVQISVIIRALFKVAVLVLMTAFFCCTFSYGLPVPFKSNLFRNYFLITLIWTFLLTDKIHFRHFSFKGENVDVIVSVFCDIQKNKGFWLFFFGSMVVVS